MIKTVFYTDQDNNQINKITPENIEGFKNFVFEVFKHNENTYLTPLAIGEHNISDEVALKDFFSSDMSPKDQRKMEEFLGERLIPNCSEKHRRDLFDIIETHPHLVFITFRNASNYSSRMCAFLTEELKNRTFYDNIKLYNNMLKNYIYIEGCEHLKGIPEPISHLSEDMPEKQTKWMEKKNITNLEKNYIQDLLESGVLLNCDNLPPKLRDKVNQLAIKSENEKTNWQNLDSKFMDNAFLAKLLKNVNISSSFILKMKPLAKLPKNYTTMHKIIMNEVAKTPKFDASNYGKEMPQNKRFCLFIRELMGKDYKIKANSLLFDIFLKTAQSDINNGRVDDLSAEAISMF